MLGFVYFLVLRDVSDTNRDLGLVKIGITTGDLMRRISSLQTGNPYDLVLFDYLETNWPREVEHFMHRTHASSMLKPEWLRCTVDRLPSLVQEARKAALQIAYRKDKEQDLASTASNGQVRRATPEEFTLHREARRILRELVPAGLALRIAGARLRAATTTANGVQGIVRVNYFRTVRRFDNTVAQSLFPEQVSDCLVETVHGAFRWRGVPRQQHFPELYVEAGMAEEAEAASITAFLQQECPPAGFTPRTPELEGLHDEYLRVLPTVHRLEGDLADVRSEMIARMNVHDGLDPICSFSRKSAKGLDRSVFRTRFPQEYKQCQVDVGPQVRKSIFPNRSYFRMP